MNANGPYSFAVGSFATAGGRLLRRDGNRGNFASGLSSLAMGQLTNASGIGSTALGLGTTAGGAGSTTTGYHTVANAVASVSIGYLNDDTRYS